MSKHKPRSVRPSDAEWDNLSQEEKDYFYRHNYIYRPEVIASRTQVPKDDWLLKVARNFTQGDSPENTVQNIKAKIEKRDKERREQQISATRREASKNGKKI